VQRTPEARGEVAGDPLHGPGVGSIALDRDIEDHVGRDGQRVQKSFAHAGLDEFVENHEALVVVAESQLT
jgi:hypothetical protein